MGDFRLAREGPREYAQLITSDLLNIFTYLYPDPK